MNKIKVILFLVKKLLSGKKRILTLNNTLTLLALVVGAIAMIIVLSVMNSLQSAIIKPITEMNSYQIRIANKKEIDKNIMKKIKDEFAEIKTIYRMSEFQAMINSPMKRTNDTVTVKALPKDFLFLDPELREVLSLGKYKLKEKEVIIGSYLGNNISFSKNSKTIELLNYSIKNRKVFSNHFFVKDLFLVSYREYNLQYVITSLETAKKYFGVNDSQVVIKLRNPKKVDLVKKKLLLFFKENNIDVNSHEIETWQNFNFAILSALKVEKTVMGLLAALIFMVISVNISQSFNRYVYKKRREIAIMKAMGLSNLSFSLVFFLAGFFLGLFGGGSGILIGRYLSNHLSEFKDFVLNVNYFVSEIFHINSGGGILDLLSSVEGQISNFESNLVLFFAIFFCSFASFSSARRVYSIMPSRILKEE